MRTQRQYLLVVSNDRLLWSEMQAHLRKLHAKYPRMYLVVKPNSLAHLVAQELFHGNPLVSIRWAKTWKDLQKYRLSGIVNFLNYTSKDITRFELPIWQPRQVKHPLMNTLEGR